jgi:SAM-dependent methyltransferase
MVTENVCVDWANTLHKNGHLDFEADLSRELPIASAEFDTIILSDVLEHIPAPEVLCREMARVLRPGGTLIMNVPFYYWLHEQPHDYYRFTEFALRKLMQEAGLRVVKLTAIGGAPEIIADVFAKSVLHTSRFGALQAALSQKFALWYIGTQRGKRFSEMTRSNFPLAYFLVATKPTTSSPDAAAGR